MRLETSPDTAQTYVHMDADEYKRRKVAAYLHMLANEVREGHIVALNVKWDGGTDIATELVPAKALDFIAIKFTEK